jgi:hypothetical protein
MYVRGCREREREQEYLKGVVQIGGKTLLVHVATLLGSEMSPREHKTCLQQLMINICPGSIRARRVFILRVVVWYAAHIFTFTQKYELPNLRTIGFRT